MPVSTSGSSSGHPVMQRERGPARPRMIRILVLGAALHVAAAGVAAAARQDDAPFIESHFEVSRSGVTLALRDVTG